MDLKNKIVVITGSSSGIGRTTAIRFAKEGAKVVVNFNINSRGGQETVDEINKISEGLLVQADVTKPKEIIRLFDEVVKKFGTVDILINNAAIPNDKVPYFEASYEDIVELVNTDLIGPMMCSKEALKYMQKQGYGKIINTSSIRGAEYGGRSVVYAASKSGINSFSKTLAKMVSPNIQVNAVAPGFVKTRNYDGMTKEQTDLFIAQTYLKRWVTEDEIADAFIFLAKNDAMTGQVIYVDAGFTLK
ncbi:MAG: 3-oxoacyl-(Acyl-carrier-protein) reductase [Candidatus Woesebacteria bacterium GW2011_GWA1_33_30]|uniref:3-oxoacyl-(Acyl-carrier-protein) reductase n=1 Tax=Candidatus Woesebacteria bacterium GW2011_GWA2_33_28 TaxID=1618561 RepID=A0A0F9ZVR0_9BACT|nr:MAG: 3-oxoacyl-(Acyl-carrier-protein) reductase [Candidatus Woesebacteria bacterium GW2011_GWA2_33_28]KKP49076.1 MAG: 3-oxoacyl-(Acyl-carrier-protein) reductase [Candidatus Woesebacteria bacterium GW2011_GWA1_33_30]KKP52667.1 MAG: 3-oxoacyl-(Acyl-carrier-protein) reductase [Candidatus Woesebacteria bacterium GW2011_GWB1_33_38]KKP58844.1 MAG: 3-oxoacyl-(Acyl-carrier-protein) reductase [Microgenomates group bacterium GW2011_GWD1_33_9]